MVDGDDEPGREAAEGPEESDADDDGDFVFGEDNGSTTDGDSTNRDPGADTAPGADADISDGEVSDTDGSVDGTDSKAGRDESSLDDGEGPPGENVGEKLTDESGGVGRGPGIVRSSTATAPPSEASEGPSSLLGRDGEVVGFLREILVSLAIVAIVGMILFAVSGVWPPMVAVESGSMQPHLYRGDLVFVMEQHRFSPSYSVGDTGVVPYAVGQHDDYRRLGDYGDVIVYRPYGSEQRTPVIHRARFWVDAGENWYGKANPKYVDAHSCAELEFCPAPHAGFITKGDNQDTNDYYDQARGISTPVEPSWIRGRAAVRVPYLGWIRLAVSDMSLPGVQPAVERVGA